MNKNLVDYQPVWAEVEPEVFDSPEEAIDWMLYQLTELHRLIRHHLFHQTRPQAFVDYVDRTRNLIQGEILNYIRKLNVLQQQQIYTRVSPPLESILEDVEKLRRIN
jgi:hypothetical protein